MQGSGGSGALRFIPVLNQRPKFVPVKRSAEFAMVAFLAVAGIERTESELNRVVALHFAHMQTARSVAAFAADVHQLVGSKFATITGIVSKTDGVTADTFRICISAAGN